MLRRRLSFAQRMQHRLLVLLGSIGLTFAFFLALPLLIAIAQPMSEDLFMRSADVIDAPPPPPPPPMEDRSEDEPEPDETPPELAEDAHHQPLDLSQLELALGAGGGAGGEGWMGGGALGLNLQAALQTSSSIDDLVAPDDLGQRPRALHQPSPILDARTRRRAPGTVRVIFVVDERGSVDDLRVLSSTDPVFEKPVLAAVKQWKFEPIQRNGRPVRFPMRVPVTIPK